MTARSVGQEIERARKAAHLDEHLFATLADMSVERLALIESGRVIPTPNEVDACARVFGARVSDLLAGEARNLPATMLLRSVYDEGRPSLDALAETGAHRVLGEFQRCVSDAEELESLLGEEARRVREFGPGALVPSLYERTAKTARLRMGLGLQPIPTMLEVVRREGIHVFFTTPAELTREIDGASTNWPRPAILVNLRDGGECWWRTRMTLAHELAHLLFHMSQKRTLFSPFSGRRFERPGKRWQLFTDFAEIEAQADAFAACFLAPAEAVRESVNERGLNPTSEDAISAVGSCFGVGRTVAINRLKTTFNLSEVERGLMEGRPQIEQHHYDAAFAGDIVRLGVGLRSGVLRELVRKALVVGKLGRAHAWQVLGLPWADALPVDGVDDAQRSPLTSDEDAMRIVAHKLVLANHPERALQPDRVERTEAGWRVEICEGGAGDRSLTNVGSLLLDPTGVLIQDDVVKNVD